MSLRVLHVTDSYGAGVATALEQYLTLPDVEHTLLARLRPEADEEHLPDGDARTYVRGRGDLLRAWRRARSVEVDVVHAHSSVAGLLVRALPHPTARVVYSPHALATTHEQPWVRRVATTVERRLGRRTSAFAAVSTAEQQLLHALAPSRSAVLVPHALEASAEPLGYADRESLVVAVGRLSYQKNPESVADLPAQAPLLAGTPVRYAWIGEGDPQRRAALERGGWEVTGWLGAAEVRARVSGARVLVHPARYEAMPLAVLEAMAVGTPVVAADIPGLHELPPVLRCSGDGLADGLARVAEEDEWRSRSAASVDLVRSGFSREAQHRALREVYARATAAVDADDPARS